MKKALMIILPVAFALGLFFLVVFGKAKVSAPSISLPQESLPTPTPTAVPTPLLSGSLSEVDNDLKMIEQDLKKVNEDTRFTPPEFIFSLGLPN